MGRLMIRKTCVLALCATLATGSWARDPFTSQETFKPSDSAEVMAWETSESLAKDNLKRRAVAAQRLPIETYMQGVLDQLYPEFAGKMRVRLMPDVGANAFAMPNGDIYVGGGMLLRMTSEAQLAALLGHEATHVTHRHGIDGFETSTGVVGGATVINVLVSAVPLPVSGLSSLVVNPLMRLATQFGVHFTALSSVAGFSRGRESEADEEGYRRMVKAGYDPKEAAKLFQNLADETKMATRNHESFFFASHPAMVERVSNFERFIKDTPAKQGVVGSEQYEALVGPMRPAMVERELKRFTMGYIDNGFVAFFERPDVAPLFKPGEAAFYKGETRRRVGDASMQDAAITAYQTALKEGWDPKACHEGMVLVYLRQEKGAEAAKAIQDLVDAGVPADSPEIAQYKVRLKELKV